MPYTAKRRSNGDKVNLYCPLTKPTKAMERRQQALLEQAERRAQKRQWSEQKPSKPDFWPYVLWAVIMIIIL
jgi:hypothetical protein